MQAERPAAAARGKRFTSYALRFTFKVLREKRCHIDGLSKPTRQSTICCQTQISLSTACLPNCCLPACLLPCYPAAYLPTCYLPACCKTRTFHMAPISLGPNWFNVKVDQTRPHTLFGLDDIWPMGFSSTCCQTDSHVAAAKGLAAADGQRCAKEAVGDISIISSLAKGNCMSAIAYLVFRPKHVEPVVISLQANLQTGFILLWMEITLHLKVVFKHIFCFKCKCNCLVSSNMSQALHCFKNNYIKPPSQTGTANTKIK